jgi:hypothetical protein
MENNRLPSKERLKEVVVEILRCGEGEQFFVRALSDNYGGLYTHYVNGFTKYCPGERCSCKHSKLDRLWKGYAPVETWNAEIELWIRAVWEITDHCEHCINGKWERGRVWNVMRRQGDIEVKKYPVQAVGGELLDQRRLQQPFDWQAVLRRQWRVFEALETHHGNPLPRQLMAEYVEGDAPAGALRSYKAETLIPKQMQRSTNATYQRLKEEEESKAKTNGASH